MQFSPAKLYGYLLPDSIKKQEMTIAPNEEWRPALAADSLGLLGVLCFGK